MPADGVELVSRVMGTDVPWQLGIDTVWGAFFFFFFPSSFTSICNPWVYDRLGSLRTRCDLVFTSYSTISALSCR